MIYQLMLLLFLISFNGIAATQTAENPVLLTAQQKQAYGIITARPEPASMNFGASYPGEVVVPNSQLQVISARLGGLVENILVAEGDSVEKGQLLAILQSPELLNLQRDLLQTLTQLNLAKTTLDRDRQLTQEGIAPERRYQASLGAWQALQTQVEQQEAALEYTGMRKDEIELLKNSRKLNSAINITAPITGVLFEQMAITGQKLQAADPLFQIAMLSPLWIEIHVPVEVISGIRTGASVSIPQLNISGEVITIGSKVHSADQGALVRAIVRENTRQLRPGQFIQARISSPLNGLHNYLVPDRALTRIDGMAVIFVDGGHGYRIVPVREVGSSSGQRIIAVEQALENPVVISGTVSLKAIYIGMDKGEQE